MTEGSYNQRKAEAALPWSQRIKTTIPEVLSDSEVVEDLVSYCFSLSRQCYIEFYIESLNFRLQRFTFMTIP